MHARDPCHYFLALRARDGRGAIAGTCRLSRTGAWAALRLLADVADSFLRDPVGRRRWLQPPAPRSELGGGRRSIAKFRSTETGSLPLLPGLTRARWAGRNSRDLQTEPHRRLGGAAAAGRRRPFLFTRAGRGATVGGGGGAAKRARRWS